VLLAGGRGELTEAIVLKEVIFAFQGITGNVIRYDAGKDSFIVDSKVRHMNALTPQVLLLSVLQRRTVLFSSAFLSLCAR